MLGWLKTALTVGVSMFKFFSSQSNPVSLMDALPFAISQLLPAVENAIKYQNLNTKEKLDTWLTTIDVSTGSDPTAVDIIKGLPADQEEKLFDHLVEVARIYGYNRIGVPGYTE